MSNWITRAVLEALGTLALVITVLAALNLVITVL